MRQAATLIASSVIALSIAATAAAWADGPVVTKLPLQVAPVRNLITIEQLSPAIIKELSHTPQDLINLRIPLKDIPLVSEPSRGDLIKATRAGNYRGFAIHVFPPVPPPEQPGQMHTYSLNLSNGFVFPTDVPDGAVFGIDVSHYEGNIDWPSVANQKIGFAYVKATQGLQYVDDKFQANWKALGDLATASGSTPKSVLLRGAYHFLSADIDPGLQAANFLYHVGPYGVRDSIANIDLPPCIDVEPDLTTAGGDTIDRWDGASHTPDDIIFRIKMFADMVELETGVRPVIYTVANWWHEHLKDKAATAFPGYNIWIADYGSGGATNKVLQSEKPRLVDGHDYVLWQFTDSAKVPGVGGVDASVFNGTQDQFGTSYGQGAVPPSSTAAPASTPAPDSGTPGATKPDSPGSSPSPSDSPPASSTP